MPSSRGLDRLYALASYRGHLCRAWHARHTNSTIRWPHMVQMEITCNAQARFNGVDQPRFTSVKTCEQRVNKPDLVLVGQAAKVGAGGLMAYRHDAFNGSVCNNFLRCAFGLNSYPPF